MKKFVFAVIMLWCRFRVNTRWVFTRVWWFLDIRKRPWWAANIVAYSAVVLLAYCSWTIFNLKDRIKFVEAQVQTMRRNHVEHAAVARTLQIAYGLSDQSSDFYAYLFRKLARKYGYPWEALGATTYIESRYDVMARSKAGACGLMQLLEPTAKEQCEQLKIPYKVNSTVWNATLNIHLGSGYFNNCYTNGKHDPQERLEEAFKRYLGGSKYRNYSKQEVITGYCADVLREYKKLNYIYKGVLLEP